VDTKKEIIHLKELDKKLQLTRTLFIFLDLFSNSEWFLSSENSQKIIEELKNPWKFKSIKEYQIENFNIPSFSFIDNNTVRIRYLFTHNDLEYEVELIGHAVLRVKQGLQIVLKAEYVSNDNSIELLGFNAKDKWYETLLENINKFYEEFALLRYEYSKKREKV